MCLVLALALLGARLAGADAMSVLDVHGRTVAYLREDGTVTDSSYRTRLQWRADTVVDSAARTLGRLRPDGWVEDAAGRTIGRIRPDGWIEDGHLATLGRIFSDGTLEDARGTRVGRVLGVRWGAPWSVERVAATWYFFLADGRGPGGRHTP
jgi:hypothetical protein